MDIGATHPFLSTYLRYVRNTESPRLFHVWSALACISAAMGRRCWFPNGMEDVYPNMYVVLVGQPATRKGTAIKLATKLLKEVANVKFAPNDSGGQRQGLLKAMLSGQEDGLEDQLVAALNPGNDDSEYSTMNGIAFNNGPDLSALADVKIDMRDPHSMFAASGELNSFIGENNTQMMTFLQEMYDGAEYTYQLKNSTLKLKDAVLNILAGTTSSQIALSMPPQAIGQGFSSRCIFVYGDKNPVRIPRPTIDEEASAQIRKIFGFSFNQLSGPFEENKEAADMFDALYMRGIDMKDPRFIYYADRRGTHLKKVSMALAASRMDMTIKAEDVHAADQLLLLTEQGMPDALGEYGMNKLSAAKQRLIDFLNNSDGPIPVNGLYSMMNKDMTQLEFKTSIADLHNAKKVTMVTIQGIGQCVIAVSASGARKAKRELSAIEDLMERKVN